MNETGRIHRKIERTAEELAGLKAERERFSRDRPGPEELTASDEYDGPYRQGDLMAFLSALAALKQERERRGPQPRRGFAAVGAGQGHAQPARERQGRSTRRSRPSGVTPRRSG